MMKIANVMITSETDFFLPSAPPLGRQIPAADEKGRAAHFRIRII
jgi:hypothetical protein